MANSGLRLLLHHTYNLLCKNVLVCLQDYADALRVMVRGHATLKLITDKPTIKMDSQTTMVRDDDDDDDGGDDTGDGFDDFT